MRTVMLFTQISRFPKNTVRSALVFSDRTRKIALLKISPSRSCCVKHDARGESHEVRRSANVRDSRPDRSADRLFEHRGRFLLFSGAVGKKANKKSGDGEHRRCDDEKIRRTNLTHVMLGDVGTKDRAESAADGDKTVKAFTLLDREQIRHECPKNGSVKEIEHADPNKESPVNPHLFCRGTASHRNEKEHEHDNEKSVSKRNECSPRHPRHSRREGRVRDHHRRRASQ